MRSVRVTGSVNEIMVISKRSGDEVFRGTLADVALWLSRIESSSLFGSTRTRRGALPDPNSRRAARAGTKQSS